MSFNKEEIIFLTKDLDINEYLMCSSGALVMNGLRQYANDINLGVTKRLFEELREGKAISKSMLGSDKFSLMSVNGEVEVFLVDDIHGINIDGVNCQYLKDVRALKLRLSRDKDKIDVSAINNHCELRARDIEYKVRKLNEEKAVREVGSERYEALAVEIDKLTQEHRTLYHDPNSAVYDNKKESLISKIKLW